MSSVALEARTRPGRGKGAARKARAAGYIPAVLYGPGEDAIPLEVSHPDFMKVYHSGHGENVLVDLSIGSGDARKVLLREVQRDPLSEAILHVDFYHVSLTKLIRVNVPVHLEGTPTGVKNAGGILQHVMREVELECLPTQIPDFLAVDVSELNIHDAIHISDLPTGDWTLMDDPTRTIASVIPPVVSKEPTAEEAVEEAVAEGAEPERIGEKEGEEKSEGDAK